MSTVGICLKVIVVGGGICGLSSAIALRRAGHEVTVYEKYPKTNDAGAGIVLRHNGVRILAEWGLDLKSVGALAYREGVVLDGKSLKVLKRTIIEAGTSEADATMKTTRGDLWSLLRQEVKREVEGQGRIRVVYSKAVTDYDAYKPAVRFADGGWAEADLVVACDGIKSRAAAIVTGTNSPAKPSGYSAFRLMVPDQDLRSLVQKFQDEELLQSKFKDEAGIVWFAIEHPGKIFVWWTCRFNKIHCFGGLCVLGDALHPMGPYRAQGGTQSIEDAGVLEICLRGLKAKEELAERLELLQRLRLARYATIQMASTVRQDDPNVEQSYQKVLDYSRKWHLGLDQSHLQNPAANAAWMVDYDAQLEAKMAVEEFQRTR
ncbi:hypothetical protein N0V82_003023 [Gnomoniopsis sp. IMI 355080]|nr:hypothetical protein N0V82_003023 [Gnomoniopsis sp. IMI 355080]